MKRTSDKLPIDLPPLLVDAKAAARLCACGVSHWYSLDTTGAIPQAVVLGKRLWAREILELWARAGCPRRDDPRWIAALAKMRGSVDD